MADDLTQLIKTHESEGGDEPPSQANAMSNEPSADGGGAGYEGKRPNV